jgi:hypothetical protein
MERIQKLTLTFPCRFGCREPAGWLVAFPDGAAERPDRIVALCNQHMVKETEGSSPRNKLLVRLWWR